MIALLAAALVAAAIVWSARTIASELAAAREAARQARALTVLEAFAPGIAAAEADPKALLVWQPLARVARALYPEDFALLDRAAGGAFPFSAERLNAAHASWTAEWLAWERMHDAEYKRRAAEVEHDRARLDSVEREKLDSYQRRYTEYVRVARALQALLQP
jgi:hypothetical protein